MEDNKDQTQEEETIIIADDLNSNHTVDPEQVKKFYKHRFISACKIFKAEDGELVVLNLPDSIENRLVEKLIERMKEEKLKDGLLKLDAVAMAATPLSTTEITPPYIKDMYRLPFDEEVIPRMTAEQREALFKKEEFNKSDLQLLRNFFAREWKAAKELWKTWRNR